MRAFITKRDGNVVNPAIGTSFDSLDEAYQFYNLTETEESFQEKRTALVSCNILLFKKCPCILLHVMWDCNGNKNE